MSGASINESWSLPPSNLAIAGTAGEQEPPGPNPAPAVGLVGAWNAPQRSAPQPQDEVTNDYEALRKFNEDYGAHVESVNKRAPFLTEQGRRAELAAFDTKPLDAIENSAMEREKQAQHHYDEALAGLSTDGDTAAELRAQRYWDRTKAKFAQHDSRKLAAAARAELERAASNPAELSTLLQELPSFLEQNSVSTDWFGGVVAQAIPELAAAVDNVAQAKRDKTVTISNVGMTRRAIASGRPATPATLVDPTKLGKPK